MTSRVQRVFLTWCRDTTLRRYRPPPPCAGAWSRSGRAEPFSSSPERKPPPRNRLSGRRGAFAAVWFRAPGLCRRFPQGEALRVHRPPSPSLLSQHHRAFAALITGCRSDAIARRLRVGPLQSLSRDVPEADAVLIRVNTTGRSAWCRPRMRAPSTCSTDRRGHHGRAMASTSSPVRPASRNERTVTERSRLA